MILYKRTCSVELQVKYTHEKKKCYGVKNDTSFVRNRFWVMKYKFVFIAALIMTFFVSWFKEMYFTGI